MEGRGRPRAKVVVLSDVDDEPRQNITVEFASTSVSDGPTRPRSRQHFHRPDADPRFPKRNDGRVRGRGRTQTIRPDRNRHDPPPVPPKHVRPQKSALLH